MSHLNRRQIEQMATVTLAISIVQEMESDQRFKAGITNLKRGRSFMYKGIQQIGETMEDNDKRKLVRVPDTTKVVLLPITSPQKDETVVKSEALASLAEYAIGKECVGCERNDWRKCRLREVLMETWIPAANDCKNDCQYKQ